MQENQTTGLFLVVESCLDFKIEAKISANIVQSSETGSNLSQDFSEFSDGDRLRFNKVTKKSSRHALKALKNNSTLIIRDQMSLINNPNRSHTTMKRSHPWIDSTSSETARWTQWNRKSFIPLTAFVDYWRNWFQRCSERKELQAKRVNDSGGKKAEERKRKYLI